MIYRDKYFHDNITVNILSCCDNRANDNTVDTITTKSLSAMQCSGFNIKMYSTTYTQCITIVRIMIFEEEANIPGHKSCCTSPKAC